jgi:hypothetical protein
MLSSLPETAPAAAVHGMYSVFLRKPFRLRAVVETVEAVLDLQAALDRQYERGPRRSTRQQLDWPATAHVTAKTPSFPHKS